MEYYRKQYLMIACGSKIMEVTLRYFLDNIFKNVDKDRYIVLTTSTENDDNIVKYCIENNIEIELFKYNKKNFNYQHKIIPVISNFIGFELSNTKLNKRWNSLLEEMKTRKTKIKIIKCDI